MRIYLSPRFEEQLKRQPTLAETHIVMLLGSLSVLSPDKALSDSKAKKLANHGDLYMFNVDSLRLFASRTESSGEPVLVFLDIQEKCGSPRYLHLLDSDALKWEVDSLVANTNHAIVDDNMVIDEMTNTNACGWWLDDYEIDSIEKHDDGTITADMTFHLTGDQLDDKMYSGTEISGRATVTISSEGAVTYEVTEVETDQDEGDDSVVP